MKNVRKLYKQVKRTWPNIVKTFKKKRNYCI